MFFNNTFINQGDKFVGLALMTGAIPPLLQGDFIWYSLDPETGYMTDGSGARWINDEGNTIMVPPASHPEPYGVHNGEMFSGRSYTLSGDGKVDVPIKKFVSRASEATYIDGGVLKYAAVDEARYKDGKLLIEGESTNLISGPIQHQTELGVDQDGYESPDGTLNAGRAYILTDGENYQCNKSAGNLSVVEGDMYTFSVFVKMGTRPSGNHKMTYNPYLTGQGEKNIPFNFDTGLWESGTVSPEDILHDPIELSNGWWRLAVTVYSTGDATNAANRTWPISRPDSASARVGDELFVFGYQCEPGIVVPTSYIPTNTDTINVPVTRAADITNDAQAIVYWDESLKEFAQETTLSGTYYILENGTYGAIAALWDKEFSADDLIALKENPELFIRFGLGEDVLSIVKGIDDKVYYPVDGYYLELGYSESSERIKSGLALADFSTSNGSLSQSGDILTFTANGSGTTAFCYISFRTPDILTVTDGANVIIHYAFTANNTNSYFFPYNGTKRVKSTDIEESFIYPYTDANSHYLRFDIATSNAGDTIDIDLSRLSLKQILSDFIPIEGTYSFYKKTKFGPQSVRFELNDAGIPTKFINTALMKFHGKGDYIDTGIVIDGSQTDFTMMMAFTGKEDMNVSTRKIVTGEAEDNDLALLQWGSDAQNFFRASIGKWDDTMDLDNGNEIHAMVAVFNHTTSQLQIATDGDALSAPFDIVFDGPTSKVFFGSQGGTNSYPALSYIGEGILSATMESEAAWFEFWKRVQIDWCDKDKPVGQHLSNYSFDCGLIGWNFDPAYPATLTDNGDGSVHLKADSNFGSLVPDRIPSGNTEWICEVEIVNQAGTGKISFRKPNGQWVSTPTLGDGVHSATYTGEIREIHVGADGDDTYEADYKYISLRKTSALYTTHRGDTVTKNGIPIIHKDI